MVVAPFGENTLLLRLSIVASLVSCCFACQLLLRLPVVASPAGEINLQHIFH
jgi:hypothetical protein